MVCQSVALTPRFHEFNIARDGIMDMLVYFAALGLYTETPVAD